jgi:hypothetical protein
VGRCSDIAESQPSWSVHHRPQERGRLGASGVEVCLSQPGQHAVNSRRGVMGRRWVGVELSPSRPGQPRLAADWGTQSDICDERYRTEPDIRTSDIQL